MTDLTLAPHSIETEENLLGAVFMDAAQLPGLRAFLQADDFFSVRHGWIWDAFCALADAGEPIDNRTVAERLRVKDDPTGKHDHMLEAIGGEAYLNYLPSNVPTALHAEIYGRIVERAALRRRLLVAADELEVLARSQDKALDEIIPEAQALIAQATGDWQPAGGGATHISEHLAAFYDGTTFAPRISTGLKGIDIFLDGGWLCGGFHIVSGRPGMGKTLLMLWSALSAAQAGNRVFFGTFEMSPDECIMRLLSMLTGLDYTEVKSEIQKPPSDETKSKRVIDALATLYDLPIHFSTKGRTPAKLLSEIKDVGDVDIVFIDRIRLMQAGVSGRDRNSDRERLNYISLHMHTFSYDLGIPFVVAAQVNRECEKRNDKRPLPSDLKESGNLEEDADIVMFLYRHVVYYDKGHGFMEVLIKKHRQGRTGSPLLKVDLPTMTLADTTMADMNMYTTETGKR